MPKRYISMKYNNFIRVGSSDSAPLIVLQVSEWHWTPKSERVVILSKRYYGTLNTFDGRKKQVPLA